MTFALRYAGLLAAAMAIGAAWGTLAARAAA